MKQINLKQYIKLIIESIEESYNDEEEYKQQQLKDLESKYHKDISEKNQIEYNSNSPKGWDLLNHTINSLISLDDPQQHPQDTQYKYKKINDIIKNDLGFKILGQGRVRKVYSKPDINFIIKIEDFKWADTENTMISRGDNKIEYNTYFNYGPSHQSKNEIFPKIYAYDKTDGMWIISEKVKTFDEYPNRTIKKIFKPLSSLFLQIIDFLKNEITFQNTSNNPLYNPKEELNTNIFDLSECQYLESAIFNNPDINSSDLFNICFEFIKELALLTHSTGDLTQAFYTQIIKWIIDDCHIFGSGLTTYDDIKKHSPKKLSLFMNKFNQHFPNLKPTPDVTYITNIIKHEFIEDLHFQNVGYRNMKLNPTEPWKNFVILDYAAYGNQ